MGERRTDRQGRVHDHEDPEYMGRPGCLACEERLDSGDKATHTYLPWVVDGKPECSIPWCKRPLKDHPTGPIVARMAAQTFESEPPTHE